MKTLETICRDTLNIGEDISIREILNFWEKYDGFGGDIIFLINFFKKGGGELVEEEKIKSKDKSNFYIFAFTPIPNICLTPEYCILYCKTRNLNDTWEYLKIKSSRKTAKELWEKPRIPLRVFLYRNT